MAWARRRLHRRPGSHLCAFSGTGMGFRAIPCQSLACAPEVGTLWSSAPGGESGGWAAYAILRRWVGAGLRARTNWGVDALDVEGELPHPPSVTCGRRAHLPAPDRQRRALCNGGPLQTSRPRERGGGRWVGGGGGAVCSSHPYCRNEARAHGYGSSTSGCDFQYSGQAAWVSGGVLRAELTRLSTMILTFPSCMLLLHFVWSYPSKFRSL